MDTQDIVQKQIAQETPHISPVESGKPEASAGLEVLLAQLKKYFNGRTNADELEMLVFGLHHLFNTVDKLYRAVLPGLEEQKTRQSAPPKNKTPLDKLFRRHHIWMQLQSLKRLLNCLDPLCLLLVEVTCNLLEALDTTNDLAELAGALCQPYDQYLQHIATQEQWEKSVQMLTENLEDWQQFYSQCSPFTTQFAHLTTSLSLLKQIDSAFDQLLENAHAVFGDILLDFQAISIGDDEAVATLLLDMQQKIDQVHIQIAILQEPLELLVKQHAQERGMN